MFLRLLKGYATTIIYDDREVMTDRKLKGRIEFKPLFDIKLSGQYEIDRDSGRGRVLDGKVTIKGYSAFREVAAPLGHLTEYDKDFFRLYGGKRTARYYSVLLFLIQQVAWLRNQYSKRSNKIKYSTLYEATGATTTKARAQTKDMFYKVLEQVFIPAGHVTRWKEATDGEAGVFIYVTKSGKITKK